MGENFQTNSLKERVLVITIPDVEVSIEKMMAIIINDIPTSNTRIQETIDTNGPVAALYSYVESKYGNKQMLNAVTQMQLVEYGTFETHLNRSKNTLLSDFGMSASDVDTFLELLQNRLLALVPEFNEEISDAD